MKRRNKFSLSHYKLCTGNMGELIPLTWWEGLPGDSFRFNTSALIRATPILAPLMHPVMVRLHAFEVPLRIIWDDFEDFITGGQDGNDTTTHPYIAVTNPTEGSLHDYMGLPIGTYTANVSALPFRAYNSIWNNFYRDQDLITTEKVINTGNGADATTDTDLLKVAWEKDFFTTARPWEQRSSDISIPIGTSAPISGIGVQSAMSVAGDASVKEAADTTGTVTYPGGQREHTNNEAIHMRADSSGYPDVYADLSQATGLSVTALREYFALQRYAEDMAQGGARYVEYLQHQWGVRQKARGVLPMYIAGGKKVLQFSEILATGGADNGSNSAVGSMRGHGIGALRSRRGRIFCPEHSIIMICMSMVPKALYVDGISREWLREEKEDYFTKQLELIGDRVVENREVYAEHSSPTNTFGYQQRYDEYRTGNIKSGIAGEFNSTLNYWHYARMFTGDQSLNEAFITCNPTKRQYADNTNDSFYIMTNHSIQARRQLAKFPKKRII
jgi:hypothetical protein